MECWFSNSSYKQVNNWVDYGGTKKYKSDFGKPYSGNLGGYVPAKKQSEKEFFWSSDELKTHFCQGCDMYLYGINEINDGLCCWCKDEEMALLDEYNNECELCEKEAGTYNDNWNATVCTTCKESLGA
jgi:hypothetical protein